MTKKTVMIDRADAQEIDGVTTLLDSAKTLKSRSMESNNLVRAHGYNILVWNHDQSNDLNAWLETVKDIEGVGVMDTYAFSNIDSDEDLDDTNSKVGQSITGDGGIPTSVQVHLKKTGSPTGKIRAKIYAHSGVFGTSSVPTGTALATSEPIEASGLTTSYVATTFRFEETNKLPASRLETVSATKYVMTIEYDDGTSVNYISVGADSSTPSHGGNVSRYTTAWAAVSGSDLAFIVNREGVLEWLPVTASAAVGTATGAASTQAAFKQYKGVEPYQALRVRVNKATGTVADVDGLFEIIEDA
jgi:hypothetical protein